MAGVLDHLKHGAFGAHNTIVGGALETRLVQLLPFVYEIVHFQENRLRDPEQSGRVLAVEQFHVIELPDHVVLPRDQIVPGLTGLHLLETTFKHMVANVNLV